MGSPINTFKQVLVVNMHPLHYSRDRLSSHHFSSSQTPLLKSLRIIFFCFVFNFTCHLSMQLLHYNSPGVLCYVQLRKKKYKNPVEISVCRSAQLHRDWTGYSKQACVCGYVCVCDGCSAPWDGQTGRAVQHKHWQSNDGRVDNWCQNIVWMPGGASCKVRHGLTW